MGDASWLAMLPRRMISALRRRAEIKIQKSLKRKSTAEDANMLLRFGRLHWGLDGQLDVSFVFA
jgi:hypothetical protein